MSWRTLHLFPHTYRYFLHIPIYPYTSYRLSTKFYVHCYYAINTPHMEVVYIIFLSFSLPFRSRKNGGIWLHIFYFFHNPFLFCGHSLHVPCCYFQRPFSLPNLFSFILVLSDAKSWVCLAKEVDFTGMNLWSLLDQSLWFRGSLSLDRPLSLT